MNHNLTPEIIAKGTAALAKWRKTRAKAMKKGGAELEAWLEQERLKKVRKSITPKIAIKNFCLNCVGDSKQDIKNCTSTKCPLYVFRPYQKSVKEE